MTEETDVLAANDAFYAVFARRDLDAMEDLWSRRAPVACIHPGWDALRGRDAVIASFRAILSNPSAPKIRCSGATAHLHGEMAFVVCSESGVGAELIATNVFVREDGAWRLVHHQAGPVARRNERETPPTGMLN
jgi:hypothetical protein